MPPGKTSLCRENRVCRGGKGHGSHVQGERGLISQETFFFWSMVRGMGRVSIERGSSPFRSREGNCAAPFLFSTKRRASRSGKSSGKLSYRGEGSFAWVKEK